MLLYHYIMNKRNGIRFGALIVAIFLVACALACVGLRDVSRTTFSQPVIDPLGSDVQCIVAPEDHARELLVRDITDARVSVFVECYLISDPDVIEALCIAHGHGCDVRVLMEESPYGGFSINDSVRGEMRAAGIEADWGNPAYSFTHAKFAVIDASIVWLMTANLTKAAFDNNRDVFVRSKGTHLAENLRRVFEADSRRVPCRQEDLVLSPGSARRQIGCLLASARISVDMVTEVFDDNELETMLTDISSRGVRVRVLVADPESIPVNEVSRGRLRETGVSVRYVASPYLHAKYIIVDDSLVYVGSHNMSVGSLDENRETGIITRNRTVLASLETSFSSDWLSGD